MTVVHSYYGTGSGGVTSINVTFTTAMTSGNGIVVIVSQATGTATSPTLTDTASNTYTKDYTYTTGSLTLTYYTCLTASPIAAAGYITVNEAPLTANMCAIALEVSQLGAKDQTINNHGTGSTFTVGPTGVTSSAVELILPAFVENVGRTGTISSTVTTGYSSVVAVAGGTTGHSLVVGYKITSSAGTQSAAGSSDTSAAWIAGITTYVEAAAAPVVHNYVVMY